MFYIDELGASFFLGVCGVDGPGDARLVWFRYGLAPFVTCYVASGMTALYMKFCKMGLVELGLAVDVRK